MAKAIARARPATLRRRAPSGRFEAADPTAVAIAVPADETPASARSSTSESPEPESPKRVTRATAKRRPDGIKPHDLVRKVYTTIDGELTKLEKQKGATSQDRERASRALSQMVTSLEKAIEMQREIVTSAERRGKKSDAEALAHAETLRREIAERVERLQRRQRAAKSAE